MLHFSHFEKIAEKPGDKHYRLTICYYRNDETEMLICVLPFGPLVRVTVHDRFIRMIKKQIKMKPQVHEYMKNAALSV